MPNYSHIRRRWIFIMDMKFDMQTLESNLKDAPCLCNVIGYDNIINKAQSNPGIIASYFGNPQCYQYQHHLESLFQNIKRYNIEYHKKKLNEDLLNPDNDNSIITEIEVAAKLAPYFKITPEYPIDQSQKDSKNLDLLIEDRSSGEKALIEIATKRYEHEVTEEPTVYFLGLKGGRGYTIKNGCYNKLEEQLGYIQSKNIDLELPLILLFKDEEIYFYSSDSTNLHDRDVEAALYDNEYGFYREENINFISTVGVYQLAFNDEYKYYGRLYHPPTVPLHEISQEFEKKFTNVFFDQPPRLSH